MKYLSFIALFFLTFLISCEKYIDLDLRKSPKILSIEGVISDTNLPYLNQVTVTKSVALGEAIDITDGNHIIKNAVVKIYNASDTFNLQYNSSTSTYTNSSMRGVPGITYYLEVKYNGKTYTSSNQMPFKPIPLKANSIIFVKNNFSREGVNNYNIDILFSDSLQTKDYYMLGGLITQKNPEFFDYVRKVREDKFFEGNTFRTTIQSYNRGNIDSTTTVYAMFSKINRDVYKYYYVLFKVTGQDRQGGPLVANGNPKTNIIGENVTGVFSAQSVSVVSKQVK